MSFLAALSGWTPSESPPPTMDGVQEQSEPFDFGTPVPSPLPRFYDPSDSNTYLYHRPASPANNALPNFYDPSDTSTYPRPASPTNRVTSEQSAAALDSGPGTVSYASLESVDKRVPWYRRRKGNSSLVTALSRWTSPRPASTTSRAAPEQSAAPAAYGTPVPYPLTIDSPCFYDPSDPSTYPHGSASPANTLPKIYDPSDPSTYPRPASPTNSVASEQSGAALDSGPGTVSYASFEPIDKRVPWYRRRKGNSSRPAVGVAYGTPVPYPLTIDSPRFYDPSDPSTYPYNRPASPANNALPKFYDPSDPSTYPRPASPTNSVASEQSGATLDSSIPGNREIFVYRGLPSIDSLSTPPPTAGRGPLRSSGTTQPLVSITRAAPTPLTASARSTVVTLGGGGAPTTSALAQSTFVSLTPSRSPPVFPERVGGHKSDGDGALMPSSAWWGNSKRQRTNTIEQAEGYTHTRSVRPFLSTNFTDTHAP